MPIHRKQKSATPRPAPSARSPSAARLTSFSKLVRVPSSARIASTRPGFPHPGRFGASESWPRDGSRTPGLPTVACVTCDHLRPASAATSCPIRPIWATSVAELRARVRSSRRATTRPVMSASATRTQFRPTSRPTTQPDSGLSSKSTAPGPLRPLSRPTSRTSRESSSPVSACDTVGFERPLRRATSARETEPVVRISSSTARSLIARSRLGVPGENAGSIPTASHCRIVRKLS